MPGPRTSVTQCPLSDLAEPMGSPSLGCLDGEVNADKKGAAPQFCLTRAGKGRVCTHAPDTAPQAPLRLRLNVSLTQNLRARKSPAGPPSL